MIDRVPCSECGALILQSTAARTGGLCRPCLGGYRRGIEEGKRVHAEETAYRSSPAGRYWADLAIRGSAHPAGFETLPDQEKALYAVRLLIGEAYRGGFYQYFESIGDRHRYAVDGLRLIGAARTLALVREAAGLLLGPGAIAHELSLAATRLPDPEDFELLDSCRIRRERLDEVEKSFRADPEDLYRRIDDLAERLGLFEGLGSGARTAT